MDWISKFLLHFCRTVDANTCLLRCTVLSIFDWPGQGGPAGSENWPPLRTGRILRERRKGAAPALCGLSAPILSHSEGQSLHTRNENITTIWNPDTYHLPHLFSTLLCSFCTAPHPLKVLWATSSTYLETRFLQFHKNATKLISSA